MGIINFYLYISYSFLSELRLGLQKSAYHRHKLLLLYSTKVNSPYDTIQYGKSWLALSKGEARHINN